MKLSSDIWVYALIRRVQLAGAFATLIRKGDARGGAVLVKTLDTRAGESRLWAQAVGMDGESLWMQPVRGVETELDAYIERAGRRDPDLWVVEIEAPAAERFLDEPMDES